MAEPVGLTDPFELTPEEIEARIPGSVESILLADMLRSLGQDLPKELTIEALVDMPSSGHWASRSPSSRSPSSTELWSCTSTGTTGLTSTTTRTKPGRTAAE